MALVRDSRGVEMRVFLVAFAAFLLSGCWEADRLYSHSEARAVIPTGTYRILKPDGSEMSRYRVSRRTDGTTEIPDLAVTGFIPLDRDNHFYLAWFEMVGGYSPRPRDTVYGLLERREREYVVLIPTCSESRALATSFGATVQEMRAPMPCKFPDRARLEAGIRALIPQIGQGYRLVPVADGAQDRS